MLVTVTFVSSLIMIFSIGYMSHERERTKVMPGSSRRCRCSSAP